MSQSQVYTIAIPPWPALAPPAEILAVLDSSLVALACTLGLGDTPEAQLRSDALARLGIDNESDDISHGAVLSVGSALSEAWRDLKAEEETPPELLAALGSVVTALLAAGGIVIALPHWEPVLAELREASSVEDRLYAGRSLLQSLDGYWWESLAEADEAAA